MLLPQQIPANLFRNTAESITNYSGYILFWSGKTAYSFGNSCLSGSDKQSTPLCLKLLNLPVNILHRHTQLPGQAGLAEKLRASPVYKLFISSNLIISKRLAALHTAIFHYTPPPLHMPAPCITVIATQIYRYSATTLARSTSQS